MSNKRQKRPFSAANSLRVVLHNEKLKGDAQEIFELYPALKTVSLQYCRFVSPFIELSDGDNLLANGMREAVTGFQEVRRVDAQAAIRAFVEALARRVDVLCKFRMSVQTEDGTWVIWNYDQPLIEWMARHGRQAVQIRARETPIDRGPVLVKLLSYICSVQDLQAAGLNLAHLV